MRVEEIDAPNAPEELLVAIHHVEAACSYERPFREPSLSVAYYRHWSEGDRRRWVGLDGGEVVGAAALLLPEPTFAEAHVFVHPEARRHGLGTELLDAVKQAAREAGAPRFFGHHHDEAGARFARAAGAVDDQRDVGAELELRTAELPEPVLPVGWRFVSWRGPTPDELIESYARARDAIDDAPTPGEFALSPIDVAYVRTMEETALARGREIWATTAVDERGEVGAFTDVRVSAPPSPIAGTDDSATAPWARRQGLATAVKLESLRTLRAGRPDVQIVRTMNAESNVGMRAVNTRVGFVPTAVLTTAVLTL